MDTFYTVLMSNKRYYLNKHTYLDKLAKYKKLVICLPYCIWHCTVTSTYNACYNSTIKLKGSFLQIVSRVIWYNDKRAIWTENSIFKKRHFSVLFWNFWKSYIQYISDIFTVYIWYIIMYNHILILILFLLRLHFSCQSMSG